MIQKEFIRQRDLINGVVPFSASTLLRNVAKGTFPSPVKLSDRVTAWRRADIEAWIANARGVSK
jgi:prophage regulatory protein